MVFKTQSGSVYEVDYVKSRIRRISGTHAPTRSQGAHGKWREFHDSFIELGYRAYIHWKKGEGRATVTSQVVSVEA